VSVLCCEEMLFDGHVPHLRNPTKISNGLHMKIGPVEGSVDDGKFPKQLRSITFSIITVPNDVSLMFIYNCKYMVLKLKISLCINKEGNVMARLKIDSWAILE
jgi:hypothetical protein